jgi:hypothetical protein
MRCPYHELRAVATFPRDISREAEDERQAFMSRPATGGSIVDGVGWPTTREMPPWRRSTVNSCALFRYYEVTARRNMATYDVVPFVGDLLCAVAPLVLVGPYSRATQLAASE